MLLIGLLLVALVCLILGLVLASGLWLIASLVASVIAGIVLWRQRDRIAGAGKRDKSGSPEVPSPAEAPRQTSLVTGTAFAGKTSSASAKPAASAGAGTGTEAVPAAVGAVTTAPEPAVKPPLPSIAPPPVVAPSGVDTEVWVVDGRPEFHSQGCARIADADSEAILFSEAIEDGFRECPACNPVGSPVTTVWVVDGRPDYHLEGCSRMSRGEPEQVPRAQAVEDGFSACEQCHPDRRVDAEPQNDAEGSADAAAGAEGEAESAPAAESVPAGGGSSEAESEPEAEESSGAESEAESVPEAEAASAPEPAAATAASTGVASDEVWVVDGRPRYHLQDCMIIKDQEAEPIPREQATEDGFIPCSMCEPNVTRV